MRVLLGQAPITWLKTAWGSMFAMVLLCFWRWTGMNMLCYMAGLKSIPAELYEAAEIDGANDVQKFTKICLPLLKSGYPGYDATQYPNAIDPCVFFDATGERLWMVYGSYSGGIFLLELAPETGLIRAGQEEYGIHLLGGNHSCIEAPCVV